MLSVETDSETTMSDRQANSYPQVGAAIENTILKEDLTGIDIKPI